MEIIVFAYWLIYFFLNLRRNNSLGLRLFGSMFNSIIRNKNKLQKPKNMYKVALGSRLLVSKAFSLLKVVHKFMFFQQPKTSLKLRKSLTHSFPIHLSSTPENIRKPNGFQGALGTNVLRSIGFWENERRERFRENIISKGVRNFRFELVPLASKICYIRSFKIIVSATHTRICIWV